MDLDIYSLEDLFLTAIKSESESRDIYRRLSDTVKNAMLKDRLRFLAEEEEKHRVFFEYMFRERFPGKRIILPNKIPVPLPELRLGDESIPISEVLLKAMSAEKKAHEFYIGLAGFFKDDTEMERAIFYIASMELSHYRILEIEKDSADKFEGFDINIPMTHIGP